MVLASPSGLNNTPTADTCSEQTFVLQTWETFGRDMDSENAVGFKYGLFKNAEIGADWQTTGDPTKHPTFQAKYGVDLSADLPRLCAGVANISDDRTLDGEVFPYVVMTYDIKGFLRVHAGYEFQKDNFGAFGGLDRTFAVADMNVMLCGDVTQVNDGHDAILAPGIKIGPATKDMTGVMAAILRHVVVETWVTFPTDGGNESYTAKLDIIVNF
jgi:hypothetical protein